MVLIEHYAMRQRGDLVQESWMSMQNEINTITSTLNEVSQRITHLVETEGKAMENDVYTELVAAERTIGTLLRRLNRVGGRIK
jgi:hypothetical protein